MQMPEDVGDHNVGVLLQNVRKQVHEKVDSYWTRRPLQSEERMKCRHWPPILEKVLIQLVVWATVLGFIALVILNWRQCPS